MLNPERAEQIADSAVRAARAYFGLSDEWDIHMGEGELGEGAAAQVTPQVDYMRAYITYDLHTMESEEQVWIRIAHEVAHLVLVEFKLFVGALEEEWGLMPPALRHVWFHADERAVSRLERMFARDRPYVPGAEAVEEAAPTEPPTPEPAAEARPTCGACADWTDISKRGTGWCSRFTVYETVCGPQLTLLPMLEAPPTGTLSLVTPSDHACPHFRPHP